MLGASTLRAGVGMLASPLSDRGHNTSNPHDAPPPCCVGATLGCTWQADFDWHSK